MFICKSVSDRCVTEVGVIWPNRKHRDAGPRTGVPISRGERLGPRPFSVGSWIHLVLVLFRGGGTLANN